MNKRRERSAGSGGAADAVAPRYFCAFASNRDIARCCPISGQCRVLWARNLLHCVNDRWHGPCGRVAATAGRKARPRNFPTYPRIQEGGIR